MRRAAIPRIRRELTVSEIPPHVFIAFDACGLGPPEESEKQALEELLALIDQHEVQCDIPEDVAGEVDRHKRAREKRRGRIVSCNPQIGAKRFLEVQRILFGAKANLSPNEINDVQILLNAYHHLCGYFVTFNKRHILSKRDEIKSTLGFDAVTPSECLAILRGYLQ
jgi:hypothetical protein